MKYRKLGASGLEVSELCLGTMTYGTQTPVEDAHTQIDMAIDSGITILDTAEVYPVNPVTKEGCGDSERIIGQWIEKSKRRSEIAIATKISGEGMKLIRNGEPINAKNLYIAIDGSLERLRTDYIDIYQLHWPNRGSYMFNQNWAYDPAHQNKNETLDNMLEVLQAFKELVDQGKVRYFGLSNESTWGTAQWLKVAQENSLPKVEAIQNEYSLLRRLFDTDLAELAHNENVGLLAWSPLATGILTGKYQGNRTPPDSRRSIVPSLGGRATTRAWQAVDAYLKVAQKYQIDLPMMALAWCWTRPFMASAIIGARTVDQLQYLLKSVSIHLPEDCLTDINTVHKAYPMPY